MYAVPWLVTLFADIFPFHKALYLWDTMVVFSGEYAVFLAVSVLIAHRHAILGKDFMDCMQFFSRLNEGLTAPVNLRYVVLKSLSMYSQTPTRTAKGIMADLTGSVSEMDAFANSSHHSILCLDLEGVLSLNLNTLCVIDLRSCGREQRRRLPGMLGKSVQYVTIPTSSRLISGKQARRPNARGGQAGESKAGGGTAGKMSGQQGNSTAKDQITQCKLLIRRHLPQPMPYKGRYIGLCADDECAFLTFAHVLSFYYRFNRVFVFEMPRETYLDLNADMRLGDEAGLPRDSF